MKRILIVIAACGMLLLASACGTQVDASSQAVQSGAAAQNVEAYGVVGATEIKNITLDFQARVEKVNVKEGEKVKSGQSLVTLDLLELESQVKNKQLQLDAAKNEVNRNLADKNPDLAKLQNDLKSAEELYNKDQKELLSNEKLYEAGSISLSELDNFKKQVESDKKTVQDIQFGIESLKYNKGSAKEYKSVEVAALESDLAILKNRLGRTYIKGSDIVSDVNNGLVYDMGYLPGDIAGPQKKLLSIMDLDSLVVVATVPEEFIKDVKTGAEATIIPTADKSRQYKGKVTYISSKAVRENGETLISIYISIDNNDGFLLPDFNVDTKIAILDESSK